ncbi:MAG: polymer-forming cytoskeletal protein [bacterium]|nr:polymer-forming cytoskeletal protein [bacterium]
MSHTGQSGAGGEEGEPDVARRPGADRGTPLALVPRGGLWEGQVAVVGSTLIDGAVNGSLRGPGELHLGPEGRIEGVIDCEIVDSQGEIIGPMTARGRARLGPGARFEGDLEAPVLEVDDDAVWNGDARIGG